MTTNTDVNASTLRAVWGEWATGVAVVSGTGTDGRPLGMAVNSFTSVSLDPPLGPLLPSAQLDRHVRAAGRSSLRHRHARPRAGRTSTIIRAFRG